MFGSRSAIRGRIICYLCEQSSSIQITETILIIYHFTSVEISFCENQMKFSCCSSAFAWDRWNSCGQKSSFILFLAVAWILNIIIYQCFGACFLFIAFMTTDSPFKFYLLAVAKIRLIFAADVFYKTMPQMPKLYSEETDNHVLWDPVLCECSSNFTSSTNAIAFS